MSSQRRIGYGDDRDRWLLQSVSASFHDAEGLTYHHVGCGIDTSFCTK